jgi:hypothetical protein
MALNFHSILNVSVEHTGIHPDVKALPAAFPRAKAKGRLAVSSYRQPQLKLK